MHVHQCTLQVVTRTPCMQNNQSACIEDRLLVEEKPSSNKASNYAVEELNLVFIKKALCSRRADACGLDTTSLNYLQVIKLFTLANS